MQKLHRSSQLLHPRQKSMLKTKFTKYYSPTFAAVSSIHTIFPTNATLPSCWLSYLLLKCSQFGFSTAGGLAPATQFLTMFTFLLFCALKLFFNFEKSIRYVQPNRAPQLIASTLSRRTKALLRDERERNARKLKVYRH